MVKSLRVFLFVCVSLQTVLCETGTPCQRPSGEVGNCILFQNCEYYVNIFSELGKENATGILRKAFCGYDLANKKHAKVCCPIMECSSAGAAVNNITSPSTTESNSEITDYVSAFLDPPDCGSSKAVSFRVVGGFPASLDDFPWMALLGYHTRIGHQWGCGGSLITVRHVLTAGHCIYNMENMLYVVRLGELDYAREDDGAYPIDFLIKTMIVHEEYDPNFKSNDIGLLILQKDVTFTKSIYPICMPNGKLRNETFENFYLLIAGWGATAFRGEAATHLQVVQLPVRKNEHCAQAFRSYQGPVFDHRVMCVGTLRGGRDACDGDSGGPLMYDDENQTYYVTGVVSYGIQCAQPMIPSIFTRVTHYMPWIEKMVLGRTMD